jgi:hypothetical protein
VSPLNYHCRLWPLCTIAAARLGPNNSDMQRLARIAVAIVALNVIAGTCWVTAYRSQRRAHEVTAVDGSIKVTAGGMLNTTVDVYDANRIANAAFDVDIVENHRDALRQLGFSAIHVQTATGQTVDKPL